jgi:hypothetical protein
MPLIIKINKGPGEHIEKILLKARKSIDGNIIISDHPELDIIILSKQKKIVALPKEQLDDEVYDSQKRLFDTLTIKGVVAFDSVQAGNLFMSMEAGIPEADSGDAVQFLLYTIANFIEKEMPFYDNQDEYEKEMEKRLLQPEVDEYTEFDPSRHDARKGTLDPGRLAQWGLAKIYRI